MPVRASPWSRIRDALRKTRQVVGTISPDDTPRKDTGAHKHAAKVLLTVESATFELINVPACDKMLPKGLAVPAGGDGYLHLVLGYHCPTFREYRSSRWCNWRDVHRADNLAYRLAVLTRMG